MKDSDGNCIDGLPPLFKIIDERANYSRINEIFDVDEKTLKLDQKSKPDEGNKTGLMKSSKPPKLGNCSERCLSIGGISQEKRIMYVK